MAASLHIAGIRKVFGKGDKAVEVLKKIDIDVAPGEFLILVGPSGCGKSTLLNIIAGLEEPTEGELRINGKNVIGMAPAQRDIAMVFQSYALYPTMSVADNIGFALEMRKVPKAVSYTHLDVYKRQPRAPGWTAVALSLSSGTRCRWPCRPC